MLAASVSLLAPRALAADPSVTVNPPPSATCVDATELREALARAHVSASIAPGADVTITIEGTPNALSVTVLRNRADTTELLPPATCEAATDAVAAFLASTLAPAVTPPAPPSTTPEPSATHAPARRLPPAPSPWAEPERGLALRDALERVPLHKTWLLLPSLEILSGSGFIAFGALEATDKAGSSTNAALLLTAGGIELAGGFGALVAGRDSAGDVVLTTFLAGEGLWLASASFYSRSLERAAAGGGFLGAAALESFNLYRRRPLGRLYEARGELPTQPLTRERAAAIESDLAQADPTIPYWLVFTPIAAGFAVAAAPDIANPKSHRYDLLFNLGMFALTGTGVALDAASGSIEGSYERALAKLGLKQLSLGPGPAPVGLSLAGRF